VDGLKVVKTSLDMRMKNDRESQADMRKDCHEQLGLFQVEVQKTKALIETT
jgi:hypothetical protein